MAWYRKTLLCLLVALTLPNSCNSAACDYSSLVMLQRDRVKSHGHAALHEEVNKGESDEENIEVDAQKQRDDEIDSKAGAVGATISEDDEADVQNQRDGGINAENDTRGASKSEDTWLSRRDSLGFITESNHSWLMRRKIHRDQMKREIEHRNGCNWCGEGQGHIWFQDHYEPSFHCEFEERIGQMGDGGKWICDPRQIRKRVKSGHKECLVYSVGSNGDFSFEESVLSEISNDCEIHTFDPMRAGMWKVPSHVQYHSVALGMAPPAKSLAEIVKDLGHTGRKIDLFKIDCEGCEWETYKSWFGSGVDIRQILVELHWNASPEAAHGFFNFLFDQGYVVFNKEPNTLGCQGDCIEYAFLKMSPSFSHDI